MRCDPLFDELTYGLPSAPVEAVVEDTRYTAEATYDPDADEFDYRLTIAPPRASPIAVSAVRVGLFGRQRGARIAWRGGTATVEDTAEIADPRLRTAVELALARASAISTGTHGAARP